MLIFVSLRTIHFFLNLLLRLLCRYLCDYIYYSSMTISQNNCAFIHVPPLNRPYTARQLAESIRVAILAMLSQIDDDHTDSVNADA